MKSAFFDVAICLFILNARCAKKREDQAVAFVQANLLVKEAETRRFYPRRKGVNHLLLVDANY